MLRLSTPATIPTVVYDVGDDVVVDVIGSSLADHSLSTLMDRFYTTA